MLHLLALTACTGDKSTTPEKRDTEDTYIPWPDDTDEPGTDADGDGWTVEEGDCNDGDVYVHPGWKESSSEENSEDEKDNDCDGFTDETFRGLVVLEAGRVEKKEPSQILLVDDFGELEEAIPFNDLGIQTIQLQDMSGNWYDFAYELAPGVSGGWAVVGEDRGSDPKAQTHDRIMVEVDNSGNVSTLVDFSDGDAYPGGAWGVDMHPDGYYLVAGLDSLYRVWPDGTVENVASFMAEDGETYLMLAFDVAVDPITGDIGVFGYYGGAAIVDPDTFEITWVYQEDYENVQWNLWSGTRWDARGGWYAGGEDADGLAVFRLDETNGTWVRKASFSDTNLTPHAMTIDTVYGGYFMSMYAGQYPQVVKLDANDPSNPAIFFSGPHSGTYFQDLWDLYTRY